MSKRLSPPAAHVSRLHEDASAGEDSSPETASVRGSGMWAALSFWLVLAVGLVATGFGLVMLSSAGPSRSPKAPGARQQQQTPAPAADKGKSATAPVASAPPATTATAAATAAVAASVPAASPAAAGAAVASPPGGAQLLRVFWQQLRFVPVALVFGLFAFLVDLEWLRRRVWVFLGVVCVGLVLVRVPGIGHDVKGSWRWINLGIFNIQVSDLAKVALVLALSHYLDLSRRYLRPVYFHWFEGFPRLFRWRRRFPWMEPATTAGWDCLLGFIAPCLIIGVVCALIAIEPDLGTMVLCGVVGFALLLMSGGRLYYIIPAVLLSLATFSTVVYHWPNRLNRVLSFIDPEGNKQGLSYQLWQGMLAFACGGVEGEGLGRGMQQRHFLPEAHTDFIFSIVGEELGLFATAVVASAFLFLFVVVVSNLRRAHTLFQFNVCLGAMLFIVLQALINMCVVIGLLPTKGMSLPFISYGGSNLVVMYVMLGLVLNCFRLWDRPPEVNSRVLPP
ncbi:MAG: putative lipid II flippase FtsW [Puniceicoccales bacterium]|jgi:cell division protein FtsW|nr:putative lipid II flippase FtsW [Puniceicoccales bacterium]